MSRISGPMLIGVAAWGLTCVLLFVVVARRAVLSAQLAGRRRGRQSY